MQSQQVYRRRKRDSVQLEGKTQRVYEVGAQRRVIRYSYDDVISNRSITFDGNDCAMRHQCVHLELIVSNFRPSRSADITIDVTVELDLTEVGKWPADKLFCVIAPE